MTCDSIRAGRLVLERLGQTEETAGDVVKQPHSCGVWPHGGCTHLLPYAAKRTASSMALMRSPVNTTHVGVNDKWTPQPHHKQTQCQIPSPAQPQAPSQVDSHAGPRLSLAPVLPPARRCAHMPGTQGQPPPPQPLPHLRPRSRSPCGPFCCSASHRRSTSGTLGCCSPAPSAPPLHTVPANQDMASSVPRRSPATCAHTRRTHSHAAG